MSKSEEIDINKIRTLMLKAGFIFAGRMTVIRGSGGRYFVYLPRKLEPILELLVGRKVEVWIRPIEKS
ncbi:MAG: hypothetical protein DRJ40_08340 [Thermoprotei archaeon]|nr:MAG: hypothetical protein DRJ40_08340 [Thermoprotei archaeon]